MRAFLASDRGPNPGAYLLLAAPAERALASRLPGMADRLELIHEGSYRASTLRLYRLRGEFDAAGNPQTLPHDPLERTREQPVGGS